MLEDAQPWILYVRQDESQLLSCSDMLFSPPAAAIGAGGASQYSKTPIRDELGFNNPDSLAMGTEQAEHARQAHMNSQLLPCTGVLSLLPPQL